MEKHFFLLVPHTHAIRGEGGDVGGSLSRPSGLGKHGQTDTQKKIDTQKVSVKPFVFVFETLWGGGAAKLPLFGG